jgi:hypothetical protein
MFRLVAVFDSGWSRQASSPASRGRGAMESTGRTGRWAGDDAVIGPPRRMMWPAIIFPLEGGLPTVRLVVQFGVERVLGSRARGRRSGQASVDEPGHVAHRLGNHARQAKKASTCSAESGRDDLAAHGGAVAVAVPVVVGRAVRALGMAEMAGDEAGECAASL